MTRLLLRAHLALHDAQESKRVRLVAATLLALLVLAGGALVVRTAFDLEQQRQGILQALREVDAAKGDPAAVQLLNQRTVTANGREYGGAGAIPNPDDLFDATGQMDQGTKSDLSWRLVLPQVPRWMPFVVVQSPMGALLGTIALAGLLASLVWLRLGAHLVEWGVVYGVVALLFWMLEWWDALRGITGMALIALLFAVLWRGVQLLLSSKVGMVAVARTTATEGIRNMAAMGFALPITVLLPMLALSRDNTQGLYQAIPGFLDWGHTAVYVCAALLVIVFGCASTAFEIRDRQVWTVLTKPVSRLEWMLGKWLGAMALGCAVLVGGGMTLYVGAHYLAAQPALDERDAREVRNTVLVGRAGVLPYFAETEGPEFRKHLLDLVTQAIAADPALQAEIDSGKRDLGEVQQKLGLEKQRDIMSKLRSIDPGQDKVYTFRGLQPGRTGGAPLSLRFKLHAGADDSHRKFPLIVEFMSDRADLPPLPTLRSWTPDEQYAVDVDSKFVDSKGELRVRLVNAGVDNSGEKPEVRPGPLTIYFDAGGVEVMYPDVTFAGNLLRALVIDVAKIAFLGALAVASATLLSFPVAVLLTFCAFSMASLTPFLVQSLEYYYPDEKSGFVVLAFQTVVKWIAKGIATSLGGFAQTAPSDLLAQGRVISWSHLLNTCVGVGVAWTTGTLLVGWLGARRKEIAIYSGQG